MINRGIRKKPTTQEKTFKTFNPEVDGILLSRNLYSLFKSIKAISTGNKRIGKGIG